MGVTFHTHSNPSANLLGFPSPQQAAPGALPLLTQIGDVLRGLCSPSPALGCCPGPPAGFSPPVLPRACPSRTEQHIWGISGSCQRLSISSRLGLQLLTAWQRALIICLDAVSPRALSFKHSGSTYAQPRPAELHPWKGSVPMVAVLHECTGGCQGWELLSSKVGAVL